MSNIKDTLEKLSITERLEQRWDASDVHKNKTTVNCAMIDATLNDNIVNKYSGNDIDYNYFCNVDFDHELGSVTTVIYNQNDKQYIHSKEVKEDKLKGEIKYPYPMAIGVWVGAGVGWVAGVEDKVFKTAVVAKDQTIRKKRTLDSEKIHEYGTLTINALTVTEWNEKTNTGGILQIKCINLISQYGSSIDVSRKGYKGCVSCHQGHSYKGNSSGGAGSTGGGYGTSGLHGYGLGSGKGGICYGDSQLDTIYLGSGGGAFNFNGTNGGGAIIIEEQILISKNASIIADGENIANKGYKWCGSGSIIHLILLGTIAPCGGIVRNRTQLMTIRMNFGQHPPTMESNKSQTEDIRKSMCPPPEHNNNTNNNSSNNSVIVAAPPHHHPSRHTSATARASICAGTDGAHVTHIGNNINSNRVNWESHDPKIVEILPILPLRSSYSEFIDFTNNNNNNNNYYDHIFFGNQPHTRNLGYGLSVRVVSHTVRRVKIHATVLLRNAPNTVKIHVFNVEEEITVMPNILASCNTIVLRLSPSINLRHELLAGQHHNYPARVGATQDETVRQIFNIYDILFDAKDKEFVQTHGNSSIVTASDDDIPVENVIVDVLIVGLLDPDHPYQLPSRQLRNLVFFYGNILHFLILLSLIWCFLLFGCTWIRWYKTFDNIRSVKDRNKSTSRWNLFFVFLCFFVIQENLILIYFTMEFILV